MSFETRENIKNVALSAAVLGGTFVAGELPAGAGDDHPGDCEPLGFHDAPGNDWTLEQTGTGLKITVPEGDNHCAIEVSMAPYEQVKPDAKFPQRLLRDEVVVYDDVGGEGVHMLEWPNSGDCEIQYDALVTGGVSNAININDPKYDEISETTLSHSDFVSWNVTELAGSKAYIWYSEKCEEEPEPTTTTTTTIGTTTTTVQQPSSTVPPTTAKPAAPAPRPQPVQPNFTG